MFRHEQILHGNREISFGLHVGSARRRSAAWRMLWVWAVFWLGTVLQPCCQIAFAAPMPQGEEAHHGFAEEGGKAAQHVFILGAASHPRKRTGRAALSRWRAAAGP